jgi:hypothetical protein
VTAEAARRWSVSIYDEIKAERTVQDAKWGGPSHDDEHVPSDWIRFIEEHAARACEWRSNMPKFRSQMVRIAALAVAAVESHDRRRDLDGTRPKCDYCGGPATCARRLDGDHEETVGCDVCCAHGTPESPCRKLRTEP